MSDRSTADLWARIENLRGQTLYTTRRHAFVMTQVARRHATAVTVTPVATGKPRHIPGIFIEQAYALGLRGGELTPISVQRDNPQTRDSSYIAAILRAIEAR